jgi:hypothetical protein
MSVAQRQHSGAHVPHEPCELLQCELRAGAWEVPVELVPGSLTIGNFGLLEVGQLLLGVMAAVAGRSGTLCQGPDSRCGNDRPA